MSLTDVVLSLPFADDVNAGIDAGGTKIDVMYADLTDTAPMHFRYDSSQQTCLKDVVLQSMADAGVRPRKMVIVAAGLPKEDGTVVMTNCEHWGVFDPQEITRLTSTVVEVVNDMVGTVAGLSVLGPDDVEVLHLGARRNQNGTKTIDTVSTGIGGATLLSDGTPVSSERGHKTWQPWNKLSRRYLKFLQKRHGVVNVSVEQAASGKHGFEAAYDFLVKRGGKFEPSKLLVTAVKMARRNNEGIGVLITAGALDGDKFCAQVMELIGSILGQYARSTAMSQLPDGGMYFVGSVMQAPGVAQYFMRNTSFLDRFIEKGARHDEYLAGIPLYLVTNPKVAVMGALELAKRS